MAAPFVDLTEWEQKVFRFLRRVSAETTVSDPVELRIAGGWVRDKLLQECPGDIDVAVQNATGSEFAHGLHAFAARLSASRDRHDQGMGERSEPGCAEYVPEMSSVAAIPTNPSKSRHLETAVVRLDGKELDFVQLRTEDYVLHSESRVPQSVSPATPEEDASRRDFTVNALFYNLHTQRVEDFTGKGLTDLQDGILRTPLDPSITLLEDPLRALRAIRFACRLQFDIYSSLGEALSSEVVCESLLRKVSRERIGGEVIQMLESVDPIRGLQLIAKYKLVEPVFLRTFSVTSESPDQRYLAGVYRASRALEILQSSKGLLEEKSTVTSRKTLLLAALIWDPSKIRHALHEALRLQKRLQSDIRKAILLSIRLEQAVRKWHSVTAQRSQKTEDDAWIEIAETVREAGDSMWVSVCILCSIRIGKDGLLSELLESGISAKLCNITYAVDGRRLQHELGIQPGPEVGKALRELLGHQLIHFRHNEGNAANASACDVPVPNPDTCLEMLKATRMSAER